METILNSAFSIILGALAAWIVDYLKSKQNSNKRTSLRNEILFVKDSNPILHNILTNIYHLEIINQYLGIKIPSKHVQAYLKFFEKTDLTSDQFKYLNKESYLRYNAAQDKVTAFITNSQRYFGYLYISLFAICSFAIVLIPFFVATFLLKTEIIGNKVWIAIFLVVTECILFYITVNFLFKRVQAFYIATKLSNETV